jgi:hypothetical protein
MLPCGNAGKPIGRVEYPYFLLSRICVALQYKNLETGIPDQGKPPGWGGTDSRRGRDGLGIGSKAFAVTIVGLPVVTW